MAVLKSDFEKMNVHNNLRQVLRKTMGPGVELFVSEGRREADHEMDEKHWLITWALTRDEHVMEAQVIRTPLYVKMPHSGLDVLTSIDDRIAIAIEQGEKWYNNAVKTGWA